MTTVLADIFWFIVTFSILVVLHEGGHFLVARAFGVYVHEFMIGLPGPALRFHGKKTDYGITAVPLGGYVRISGMEPAVPLDGILILLFDPLSLFRVTLLRFEHRGKCTPRHLFRHQV